MRMLMNVPNSISMEMIVYTHQISVIGQYFSALRRRQKIV